MGGTGIKLTHTGIVSTKIPEIMIKLTDNKQPIRDGDIPTIVVFSGYSIIKSRLNS